MNPRFVLWVAALSALLSGAAHSAGGPMNEDLTPLLASAQVTVEAGKRGDAEAFLKNAQELLAKAKEHAPSAAQQRIVGKLKIAVAEGKDGRLPEGTAAVEVAMTDMKKSGPPQFGGGS
jgi:hypothetical protein